MKTPTYPLTRKVDQVDTYHGVVVKDSYRWLEDRNDPEMQAWKAAQNSVTAEYLAATPLRYHLRCRFEELLRYSRYYDFFQRGPYLIFKRNDSLQNQLVLYVQRGWSGKPEVLIDPNELALDGTIRLKSVVLSRDGQYLAYGLSKNGIDWEEYFVKDMMSRQDLPDRLRWVKASMIAWRGDGFYYGRYPEPSDVATALSARNANHQVWYHRVGTPQATDTLVYEDRERPLRLHFVETTEDERFAVLTITDGSGMEAGSALWLLDVGGGQSDFTPVVTSFQYEFQLVASLEDHLLVVTTCNAPNRRLVLIDPAHPKEHDWKEVIPEKKQPLELVRAIGGKLFVVYRRDAGHRLYVLDQSGSIENEVPLPGSGLANVFPGQQQDTDAFWSFTSFTTPPTIYRYDIVKRASLPFYQPAAQFRSGRFQTKQIFYPSKDGTQIPMFIVHRNDLVLDGNNPSLLYAYGGNGASVGPEFDPLLIALLERGYVFAAASLRGGGEYGEAWHRAGWRDKKQNVFDDCIAAAEWLQANGYTNRHKSALIGASNGGLLVGAVMAQRPDLFKVALPIAGVMDMLRFQNFTLGGAWTTEYGSSDDPTMFPTLLAYSPLHNIKAGTTYPATLVTTYEDDDCVVPFHSFKFVATLQELGAGPHPYLLRVESNSGHGAVSLPKAMNERADLYAFLLLHIPGTEEPASDHPAV